MHGCERRVIAMSDIEMGAGGVTDDFRHDDWLARTIIERGRRGKVDLVLNGDTFDFLKMSVGGRWHRHIDAPVALAKLDRLATAHPRFFEALTELLRRNPKNRVVFVVGNHDQELVFPELKADLRRRLGCEDRVLFPGVAYRIGDVHIEHGQQADVMFAFDADQPFLEFEGRRILNLPWGSVALIDVAMPTHELLYAYDRLRPRQRPIELVPEAKELLLSSYWRYWTRDYLRGVWKGHDPLNRLNWTMFKEIVHRFGTASTEVSSGHHWRQAIRENNDVRVVILGHEHTTEWWTWGDRKLLRDGCIRDEYLITCDGTIGGRLPKVWAEVLLRDGRAVRSALIEAEPPAGDSHGMPARIQDTLPTVQALLAGRELPHEGPKVRQLQEQAEQHRPPEERIVQAHPARSLRETPVQEEE